MSDRVESIKDLRLIEPLGYLDFLNLSSSARLVLTDSGGIQEETTALGIPCLTLRENTERPITVEMGTNVIVGTDTTKIIAAASATLNGSAKKALKQPPLWDGHTSERILDALEESLPLMPVLNKIKRALRGEVKLTTAAREAWRRSLVSFEQRKERAHLNNDESLSLKPTYARMSADELLAHFRGTREAKFFSGLIPSETDGANQLQQKQIVNDHSWPLLGFGEQSFGNEIQWRRDPLSNYVWPLDYHRDIRLVRADGSDVRVLWELNRLGHLLTLACAYATTHDERYSAEFFAQLRSWHEQNPYGRGPNWTARWK